MVLGTPEILEQVTAELAAGTDFAELAVRFSQGPAAARGGDIGWIDPRGDGRAPAAAAIRSLGVNEISPPVEAGGLFHLFKRIR